VIHCVVFQKDFDKRVLEKAGHLTIETYLVIEGVVRRDERSKAGYEIGVTNIEVLRIPEGNFPITLKKMVSLFSLKIAIFGCDLRARQQGSEFATDLNDAIHNFINNKRFIRFIIPIFTPSACEGTTTFFERNI